ncbi:hypothetical protein [Rhodoferax sp.]|uniref:hypothetical protein n=1 Tax=Rhodoferax sp. TaxID=50421 RepID=UPI0026083D03|nr:hypothetical protein [Rhodoferax sp.]MDD5479277.1 hypothetical protein [Rhodoferax sp.]
MKSVMNLKNIAACALFISASTSFAHENHGLAGSHWHATDTWGFVALGALVVLGFWFSGHDK